MEKLTEQIIIGQACEFDYSGTQACKALEIGK
jgi:carbamoylphosphate synthase large subunit